MDPQVRGPAFAFDYKGGVETRIPDGLYGRSTAQLTPEYQAKLDKKIAEVARGVEWDALSNCLPAGYPRWLTEPFLKEIVINAGRNLVDKRTAERGPPHLHRRSQPRPGGRGLSSVGRRFDRLLGRRHPGGAHQQPDVRTVSARAAGLFGQGLDHRRDPQDQPRHDGGPGHRL